MNVYARPFQLAISSMICLVLSLAITTALPAQQARTYKACYVPEVGAVYLIGGTDLPAECRSASHVAFSWTDGGDTADGAVADPAVSDSSADADLSQYLLTDGVRQATHGFAVTGTLGTGTIPMEGPGVRLMWYPSIYAFRAGYVDGDQWDEENVGLGSMAVGHATKASGEGATATGVETSASGRHSTAMGRSTSASGRQSTAMGTGAEARGIRSTAMGDDTEAIGHRSTATGSKTKASGNTSTAMGRETIAEGWYSTAMGWGSTASGDTSTAMGTKTSASGATSTAMGSETNAEGSFSTAMGLGTTASGDTSTAMGYETTASGATSTAMGRGATASGTVSTAMGAHTEAGGTFSTAMGIMTTATGHAATAMGGETVARGNYSTAMGASTIADGYMSTAMGHQTEANGRNSLAAGVQARVDHDNTLVWSGQCCQDDKFSSTDHGQFLIDAPAGVGIGTNSPRTQLDVFREVSGSAGIDNHVVRFRNTASSNGDVLMLESSTSGEVGRDVNFITFRSADGNIGSIEGNGGGGIRLYSSGGDFAERLPRLRPAEMIEAGDVVGLFGGSVSRRTTGADQLMVVTDRAIVLGNDPGPEARADYEAVAFLGQVPVKVSGPVEPGDLLVASDRTDGTARAVSPADYRPTLDGPVVGQAWEASAGGTHRVNALIGADGRAAALESVVARQQARLERLEEKVDLLAGERDRGNR